MRPVDLEGLCHCTLPTLSKRMSPLPLAPNNSLFSSSCCLLIFLKAHSLNPLCAAHLDSCTAVLGEFREEVRYIDLCTLICSTRNLPVTLVQNQKPRADQRKVESWALSTVLAG